MLYEVLVLPSSSSFFVEKLAEHQENEIKALIQRWKCDEKEPFQMILLQANSSQRNTVKVTQKK